MHIYESHLGGFYTSDEEISYDNLRCDSCGDSDTWVAEINNLQELDDFFESATDYNKEYLEEIKLAWKGEFS